MRLQTPSAATEKRLYADSVNVMAPMQSEPDSPDDFRITVDGQEFHVRHDSQQPGCYHYSWLTGPAEGYGFSSGRSDHQKSSILDHEVEIRSFLGMVDPETGYIEDD